MKRSNPRAWTRAVNTDRMYISKKTAIHVPFTFVTRDKKAYEKALLDSGATHNFMDKRMAKRLGIGTRPLKVPRTVTNVDGTKNVEGELTRYTNLEVTRGDTTEILEFFITNLGNDRAIFGFPWLQTFEPKVNWRQATISGETTVRTTNEEATNRARIRRITALGKAIATTINLEPGEELHIGRTNIAQQWAENAHKRREEKKAIPKEYSEYSEVFSEEAARRFPPTRQEDHAIVFKPDAPDTFSCKIYPISSKETESLRA